MSLGITDLNILLKSLSPHLHPGEYVFCELPHGKELASADIIGSFKEAESLTVVLNKESAIQYDLDYTSTFAWITLEVNSSLNAVGLTAAFSNALAYHNISCNVIAAFHHDHIFVPFAQAEKALEVLQALSK